MGGCCVLREVDDVFATRLLSRLLAYSAVGKFRLGDGLIPEMLEPWLPGLDDLRSPIFGAGVDDENLVFEVDFLLVQGGEQLVQIVLAVVGGDEDGGFDVSHGSVWWPLVG